MDRSVMRGQPLPGNLTVEARRIIEHHLSVAYQRAAEEISQLVEDAPHSSFVTSKRRAVPRGQQ